MSYDANPIVSLTIDFLSNQSSGASQTLSSAGINSTGPDIYNYTNYMSYSNDNTGRSNGNTSANDDDEDDYTLRNLIVIIFYTIIICVSFCGNLLVLRVIFGKRKMRTTTNLLIASLALADFLTTTLNIPFNVTRFLTFNYPFGRVLCILVPFIQVCCVYVSTLTMGVIAIHRFWTIIGTTSMASKSMSTVKLAVIIVVVWVIAGVLALPHSTFNRIVPTVYKNVTYDRCRVVYPKLGVDFAFWLSIEAIPLSITCTLYIKIGFVVAKQGRIAGKASDERKKQHDDARRRRIVMRFILNISHLDTRQA
ncbi:unnamed protein product [Oppiella nova]|uniref:G-protein coupled receptors family 1 profile domain-containing protein n=1 Tax=Oppiella nova TaxID=334625 RepID=A0A7R9QKY5_9ACAR|nr:unnamed protein product [Oppiella nova]CAG2167680.1 unnamed protein product [Oppiella nova]